MSQHDLSIANQGFPAFRSDLNNALQALGSMQSGTSEPATTYANMLWYDTTNNIVKMRNEDNDAWISLITLNQTNDIVAEFVATSFIPSGSTVPTNGLYLPAANSVGIATNSSERVRVDSSGNVGIGTSSPSYGLDIRKSTGGISWSTDPQWWVKRDSGAEFLVQPTSSLALVGTFSNHSVAITTNNTERMRIDSSGNVGIGTSSPSGRLHVASSAGNLPLYVTSSAASQNVRIRLNSSDTTSSVAYVWSYSDASLNKQASIYFTGTGGLATQVGQTAGSEPTSGTLASFIDSSGNVGIGTSSPTQKLTVAGSSSLGTASASGNTAIFQSPGSLYLTLNTNGTLSGNRRNWAISPEYDVAGALSFTCGASEGASPTSTKMIIDSSGNLLVGTTSGTQKLAVVQDHVSNNTASFRSTNASFAGDMIIFGADRNTTNNSFYPINYYNYGASAYKFRVADSGNVTNTNNSYGAISDIKLKENIVDATPKLAALQNVRIVNYNRIGSEEKELGVIAQELEQVFPALVETHIDRDREGNDLGTTTKSVKYSVFVPMLIKAIQEQQAIIESLTTRIAALEAK